MRRCFYRKGKEAYWSFGGNSLGESIVFCDQVGQVASIDTLESFMKDFKKRYDSNAVN